MDKEGLILKLKLIIIATIVVAGVLVYISYNYRISYSPEDGFGFEPCDAVIAFSPGDSEIVIGCGRRPPDGNPQGTPCDNSGDCPVGFGCQNGLCVPALTPLTCEEIVDGLDNAVNGCNENNEDACDKARCKLTLTLEAEEVCCATVENGGNQNLCDILRNEREPPHLNGMCIECRDPPDVPPQNSNNNQGEILLAPGDIAPLTCQELFEEMDGNSIECLDQHGNTGCDFIRCVMTNILKVRNSCCSSNDPQDQARCIFVKNLEETALNYMCFTCPRIPA